jgi:hypothetical protein
VSLATQLTYLGVILSGIYVAFGSLYSWSRRDDLIASATRDAPPDTVVPVMVNTSLTVGLIIGVLSWLLPAAGTVVCIEFARRGSNAARVVLACLTGVFALYNVCGAGGGLLFLAAGGDTGDGLSITSDQIWWTAPTQALLAGLAIAIMVMLLIPSANRYFSAGPGRRFAPSL